MTLGSPARLLRRPDHGWIAAETQRHRAASAIGRNKIGHRRLMRAVDRDALVKFGRPASYRRLTDLTLGPILAACIVAFTGIATASGQVRTTTHDGIPLDEPFRIRVGPVILQIPAGYIGPWPTPKAQGRISARQPLHLNFWMPDRRYVEVGDLSIAGFRPKEPGRGVPAPEASVVRVNDLRFLKPNELGTRSPEKQFQNSTSYAGLSSYSFKEEEFGLVRYWQHNWPHPNPEPFLRYRNVEGSHPHINLSCTPPHLAKGPSGPGVNPMCIGHVYIESDELSFLIWFSGTNLPLWREHVFAVRDLVQSWKTQ